MLGLACLCGGSSSSLGNWGIFIIVVFSVVEVVIIVTIVVRITIVILEVLNKVNLIQPTSVDCARDQ